MRVAFDHLGDDKPSLTNPFPYLVMGPVFRLRRGNDQLIGEAKDAYNLAGFRNNSFCHRKRTPAADLIAYSISCIQNSVGTKCHNAAGYFFHRVF